MDNGLDRNLIRLVNAKDLWKCDIALQKYEQDGPRVFVPCCGLHILNIYIVSGLIH